MNNIFSDLLNIYIVVYLDDILIYLDNMSQHWDYIKKVLYKLYIKCGLYLKRQKSKEDTQSLTSMRFY